MVAEISLAAEDKNKIFFKGWDRDEREGKRK